MSLYSKFWEDLPSFYKYVGCIGGTVLLSEILYYYTVKARNRNQVTFGSKEAERKTKEDLQRELHLMKYKPHDIWNTSLFFAEGFSESSGGALAQQFLDYFRKAVFRIQICMYLASYAEFEKIISRKFDEGKNVQVITDYDTYTAHNNYCTDQWGQKGIEIRMKNTGTLMHHKFIIIDEIAVITGSLNWTRQGLLDNCENVLVTTNKKIVQLYMQEFSRIWQDFLPIQEQDLPQDYRNWSSQ